MTFSYPFFNLFLSLSRPLLCVADINLFVSLLRFDLAFSCKLTGLRKLEQYPNILNYFRELYQHPAFKVPSGFRALRFSFWAPSGFWVLGLSMRLLCFPSAVLALSPIGPPCSSLSVLFAYLPQASVYWDKIRATYHSIPKQLPDGALPMTGTADLDVLAFWRLEVYKRGFSCFLFLWVRNEIFV